MGLCSKEDSTNSIGETVCEILYDSTPRPSQQKTIRAFTACTSIEIVPFIFSIRFLLLAFLSFKFFVLSFVLYSPILQQLPVVPGEPTQVSERA